MLHESSGSVWMRKVTERPPKVARCERSWLPSRISHAIINTQLGLRIAMPRKHALETIRRGFKLGAGNPTSKHPNARPVVDSESKKATTHDPHAFLIAQNQTSTKAAAKRHKRHKRIYQKKTEVHCWDRLREMESTLKSARNIIRNMGWEEQSYICMFVGGSTIHLGLVNNKELTTDTCWLDATAANLANVKPEDSVEDNLGKMVAEYARLPGNFNADVRMLLAGSPTMVNSDKYTEKKAIHDAVDVDLATEDGEFAKHAVEIEYVEEANNGYTFFPGEDVKVEKVTSKKLDWLVRLSTLPVDWGGLYNPERSLVNGGNIILTNIQTVVHKSRKEWQIACGNREMRYNPKKPESVNSTYYCSDKQYATDFLPKGCSEDREIEIVSSGMVAKLKKLNAEEIVAKYPAEFGKTKVHTTAYLVTAGHEADARKDATKLTKKKVDMIARLNAKERSMWGTRRD